MSAQPMPITSTLNMSAFGGKADILDAPYNVR